MVDPKEAYSNLKKLVSQLTDEQIRKDTSAQIALLLLDACDRITALEKK